VGHQDGSMSSSCSRRSSGRAPADDPTGRPSARRCSISAPFRAAAPGVLEKDPYSVTVCGTAADRQLNIVI
jgi:hypothetical protein